jgi:dCMP deaminase
MDWDEYFDGLVEAVSRKSKDPSTKVGAIIVGKNNNILSTGYNGFPRGVTDSAERYGDRLDKYKYIEHAERNAIYNAARHGVRLDGATLCCNWYPCNECAKAIVQSGIIQVNILHDRMPLRWKENMKFASNILEEAGVKVRCNRSDFDYERITWTDA